MFYRKNTDFIIFCISRILGKLPQDFNGILYYICIKFAISIVACNFIYICFIYHNSITSDRKIYGHNLKSLLSSYSEGEDNIRGLQCEGKN